MRPWNNKVINRAVNVIIKVKGSYTACCDLWSAYIRNGGASCRVYYIIGYFIDGRQRRPTESRSRDIQGEYFWRGNMTDRNTSWSGGVNNNNRTQVTMLAIGLLAVYIPGGPKNEATLYFWRISGKLPKIFTRFLHTSRLVCTEYVCSLQV